MGDTRWIRAGGGLLGYLGLGFVLHFIWEHMHMPLYELPSMTTWEGIRMCLFATATGDMLFMLSIYVAIALAERDPRWLLSRAAYRHASTWFLTVALGALLAISYELWAVYVERRWSYAQAMPMVPVLGVGISPLLQMIVVPGAALAATRRLAPPGHQMPRDQMPRDQMPRDQVSQDR